MKDDFLEEKIIFKEGNEIRVLRGIIDHEDQFFIYVRRRDGEHRINKNVIVKISPDKNKEGDSDKEE